MGSKWQQQQLWRWLPTVTRSGRHSSNASNSFAHSVFEKGGLTSKKGLQVGQHTAAAAADTVSFFSLNGSGPSAISAELLAVDQLPGEQARFASWASLLKRCGDTKSLSDGKTVHAHIRRHKRDRTTFLANWVIQMFGDCGSMADAQAVFDQIPKPNLHSWTVLIGAYAKNNCGKMALDCLHQMQLQGLRPNHVTFVCALDACGSFAALEKGKEIHAAIVEGGFLGEVPVGTALVSMYGKCGSLQDAMRVFHSMPQRNVISWNAIISACIHNGNAEEALELFHQMQQLGGLKPDTVTFICAIDACANLAVLEKGQEIHACILESGCSGEVNLGNALIDMYGKCGSLQDARMVFDGMVQRDVVSWNAMIAACAQNGHHHVALDLYHEMQQNGINPDQITFVGVLTACSHTGQVGAGKEYFDSMLKDYSIRPQVEHYVCLIDILGRAGSLAEAEDLIHSMPFRDEATVWLCLLGACRIHGDVERGLRAASHIVQLDPENASPYVLLSSIYAAAGKWDEARKVREIWTNGEANKNLSLIDYDKLDQKFARFQAQDLHTKVHRLSTEVES
ncbi:hypothetical protein O6H91_11G031500 [Diphasiastrum complanatum]|uniref:Uncharacterized protein n=2 Tax=Diphasiastrum complanatum TaxID=34168 RepID=A0ACC2C7P4_DIPCM|nr:hypothetical protein O6H91_11G031500 [Diphasiastrum complanatum]